MASERAKLCRAESARFEVLDIRDLQRKTDLIGKYDVAICAEVIEHIIDDKKLLMDIAMCLKPGGRLLLTTPYLFYRRITLEDDGPFSKIEDGSHVRRGYSKAMLEELCRHSGLIPEEISYCSGILSQKITAILRYFSKIHPLVGWVIVLPFRFLPIVVDRLVSALTKWPYYCICLEAYKPFYRKEDIEIGEAK
jgi:SAM-dependent methyltransferase